MTESIEQLSKLIQAQLMLVPVPRKYRGNNDHPWAGTCYVASEAFYHLYPDQNGWSELSPIRIGMPDGTNHWFLRRTFPSDGSGMIPNAYVYEAIDLTIDQYDDKPGYKALLKSLVVEDLPKAAFLTKQPSKRAQTLMDHVLGSIV